MMSATKDREAFVVVTPPGKSKRFAIAARRIGSKSNYGIVATTTSETLAKQLVTALALLQGEEQKLEVIAQRTLAGVREELMKERARSSDNRATIHELETQRHSAKRDLTEALEKLAKAEAHSKDLEERILVQGRAAAFEIETQRLLAEAHSKDLEERILVQGNTISELLAEQGELEKLHATSARAKLRRSRTDIAAPTMKD